ncbi:helix-turn-helix domain-containing protein [Desulfoferrobacter suflitae]|uniref:helix-turn-helix domain-containing protein n=1 Tax=Desulfoferrobacter suflitae TaxID=2865782 RepID=UPI00216438A4|nr:helix-turn-helix domain-containing protein [Desulfoferrobacter suflitae]MCK8600398.1 DUF4115 domain-containing protein [Desulfoferrobacter suflitae]
MTEPQQSLKQERIRQGLSLQDVFERTRISESVLHHLEEGNYDQIGTPLLVRNFIRTYCSALGIDAEPILEDHAAVIVSCDRQPDGIRDYRKFSLAFANKKRRWSVLAMALVVLILASIVTGAWIANRKAKLSVSQSLTNEVIPREELPPDLPRTAAEKATTGPVATSPGETKSSEQTAATSSNRVVGALPAAPIKEPSIAALDSKPTETASSAPSQEVVRKQMEEVVPAADQRVDENSPEEIFLQVNREPGNEMREGEQPVAQSNEHTLSADASQEVWIQVRTDNKSTYNALMKPGERREWKAQESMQITIGNAGGLDLKWDGKALRKLGKSGEVVRFKLPDPKFMEES